MFSEIKKWIHETHRTHKTKETKETKETNQTRETHKKITQETKPSSWKLKIILPIRKEKIMTIRTFLQRQEFQEYPCKHTKIQMEEGGMLHVSILPHIKPYMFVQSQHETPYNFKHTIGKVELIHVKESTPPKLTKSLCVEIQHGSIFKKKNIPIFLELMAMATSRSFPQTCEKIKQQEETLQLCVSCLFNTFDATLWTQLCTYLKYFDFS